MRKLVTALGVAAIAGALLAGSAFANSSARPFNASGTGTETSLSGTGCQFTLAGCTIQVNGTATSSHLGTGPFMSTLTVDWAAATSNGQGGYCAPFIGTATFTAANGDEVFFSYKGTACEVGKTGDNVPHTITGTYTITGGTGRFTGASGSGTLSGGDDGYGNATMNDSGTIGY